jgi:hypothetical protein
MIELLYRTGAVADGEKLHAELLDSSLPVFGVSTRYDAREGITVVHVEDDTTEGLCLSTLGCPQSRLVCT